MDPWSGKMPPAEQPSLQATRAEPEFSGNSPVPRVCAPQQEKHRKEKPCTDEEAPLTAASKAMSNKEGSAQHSKPINGFFFFRVGRALPVCMMWGSKGKRARMSFNGEAENKVAPALQLGRSP